MKYIIEFEDEPSMIEAGLRYYQCKQVPYWGVSHGIIKNLTPYTEPDRKAIEDEVWEFVKQIECMTFKEIEDCFDTEYEGVPFVANMFSYQEAKAKYDAWKKQKEDEATMKEVTALAEKIGIHKLYSMVKEIRGE